MNMNDLSMSEQMNFFAVMCHTNGQRSIRDRDGHAAQSQGSSFL